MRSGNIRLFPLKLTSRSICLIILIVLLTSGFWTSDGGWAVDRGKTNHRIQAAEFDQAWFFPGAYGFFALRGAAFDRRVL